MTRKQIQRQGMEVTIKQLKYLVSELEKEEKEVCKQIGIKQPACPITFQINIINTIGASDTWKIEMPKKKKPCLPK